MTGTPVRDVGRGYPELVDDGRAFKTLTFSFLKSQMTDGGGTSGTFDSPVALPAGALVLGWMANATVAFTGDTTATLQIGDSGSASRFSTTTNGSVFTAQKISSFTVVATAIGVAAVTPRVTITSTADFTNIVGTGACTVTIFYLDTQTAAY